jgi:uncharacterized protein YkwD
MAHGRRFLGAPALAVVVCLALASPSAAQPTAIGRSSTPAAPVVVASPSPSVESQFVSRINSLRASKGLSQLQVSGELLGVARAWTEQMVAAGQISHNPNLGSQVGGAWTKLGENVGVGYDVDGLMQAFINSPGHYANLIDPVWTYVAVGVTYAADGRIYTTHNFMALGGAPPPATPPPPSSPPVTSPPPAAPPATTTTTAPPPPPEPHPTEARVAAVLDPLRSLEHG